MTTTPAPVQPETEPVRVAVIVFCDVIAPTEFDALAVTERTVRRALEESAGEWPARLNTAVPWGAVKAVRVMEAGTAIGNGYLWSTPTRKAWSL